MRSSTLRLLAEHCPAALDHLDAGTPTDRDLYAEGIAAHAILQALGAMRGGSMDPGDLAYSVAYTLATEGRSFDGRAEPPLPLLACLAGRQLALDWLSLRGMPPNGARYEVPLAMDAEGRPVEWSRDAWYRGAIDVLWTESVETEECASRTLVVRDWKSSWQDREEALQSLQLRGYALLALADADPEPDAIRLEIAHLRARTVWDETVWLDDDGLARIESWRRDLGLAVAVADTGPAGKRPARPGAGCPGCPYLAHCEPARALLGAPVAEDVADIARDYAVSSAWTDHLAAHLRVALADREPVQVPGGTVGYVPRPRRTPTTETAVRLCDAWGVTDSRARGLVAALEPGVTAVERVARRLHPNPREGGAESWREDREALVTGAVTTATVPIFSITRQEP